MTERYVSTPITSAHQFPTLAPETNSANATTSLAAGLGLVTFQDVRGLVWFKGGHNDWTGNMVICMRASRRSTNGRSSQLKYRDEVASVA